MRLLLDSQVVYQWVTGAALPERAQAALDDSRNHLVVSTATLWELAIKQQSGKLAMATEEIDALVNSDLAVLNITPAHALAAARLPLHHRDLFDRMLVAQAQVEGLTLVGGDKAFAHYDVALLWA